MFLEYAMACAAHLQQQEEGRKKMKQEAEIAALQAEVANLKARLDAQERPVKPVYSKEAVRLVDAYTSATRKAAYAVASGLCVQSYYVDSAAAEERARTALLEHMRKNGAA